MVDAPPNFDLGTASHLVNAGGWGWGSHKSCPDAKIEVAVMFPADEPVLVFFLVSDILTRTEDGWFCGADGNNG